jgi:hypothetical protein
MWLTNGGLLAAVLAVVAAAFVAAGAWFSLVHRSTLDSFLGDFSDGVVGAVTLVIVSLAGWLLATAFDRGEESYVLFRERSSDDTEAGD